MTRCFLRDSSLLQQYVASQETLCEMMDNWACWMVISPTGFLRSDGLRVFMEPDGPPWKGPPYKYTVYNPEPRVVETDKTWVDMLRQLDEEAS